MTPKELEELVLKKIKGYHPLGHLDRTARLILTFSGIFHKPVKIHLERVALLSERTAQILGKDTKAAFFSGETHDIGKLVLPFRLFDGHSINPEEYLKVKTHAIIGFMILKRFHKFVALCSGLHHGLYVSGYGITIKDFPKNWSPATVKKVFEISTIVSICDFIDAFTHRTTKILDGSDNKSSNLLEILKSKYPNDIQTVEAALRASAELNL